MKWCVYAMKKQAFQGRRKATWRARAGVSALSLVLSLAAMSLPAQAEEGRLSLRERIAQRRAATAPTPAAAALPLTPGDHEIRVAHQGLERKVVVHVPRAAEAGQPLPLVLALHGGGGFAEFMADDARYGLIRAADEGGFIVAFPNGYSRFAGGRLATWNAGACCGDARDRQVDDVGFLRAVVAQLQAHAHIDSARIFATGMSNGGMMAYRLACEASDLFRAVASVAGTDNTLQCTPARPVSVLHIHARDDDHVLFEGGAGPGAFRDASKVTDFTSVPETMRRWAQRDRCEGAPQRTQSFAGASCEAYARCAQGVRVELCVTDSGGHSWPGGVSRRGKAPSSTAFDAARLIWDFFAASSAPR